MKRVKWLQQFFDELQRDQTLRSSEIFYLFFSLAQKTQFDSKKKDITKLPAPKTVFEMKHLKGKADAEVNEHKIRLCRNIGVYSQGGQNLYIQLLASTNNTVKVMQLLSDSLARNADLFKQVGLAHAMIEVLHDISQNRALK